MGKKSKWRTMRKRLKARAKKSWRATRNTLEDARWRLGEMGRGIQDRSPEWWSKYTGISKGVDDGFYSTGYRVKNCLHVPVKLIETGDGSFTIWAAEKSEAEKHLSEFDAVLNCSGFSIKPKVSHRLPKELAQSIDTGTEKMPEEFYLDWDDYSAINMKPEFWKALIEYVKERKWKLLVFCHGGHGRTGTSIACLLIAGCGMDAKSAEDWVHANYCKEAIEGKKQHRYIQKIASHYRGTPLPPEEPDPVYLTYYKQGDLVAPDGKPAITKCKACGNQLSKASIASEIHFCRKCLERTDPEMDELFEKDEEESAGEDLFKSEDQDKKTDDEETGGTIIDVTDADIGRGDKNPNDWVGWYNYQ